LLYSGLEMPDSLVAKWLVRPLAAASIVTVGSSGGLPTSIGSTTTTVTPPDDEAQAIPPTKLGINLMYPKYWNPARPFTNLMHVASWGVSSVAGDSAGSYFDNEGRIIKYQPGDMLYQLVSTPLAVFNGKSVDIVCRWDGKATVRISQSAAAQNVIRRATEVRFTYMPGASFQPQLKITDVDLADPIRNIDCREPSAPRDQFFDPDYLSYIKRFSVLRFMVWQDMNENKPVTWATRSRMVGKDMVRKNDSVPIEVMIDLANAADADPWFCIPWNADEDYVRKFAELVRDRLKPGRKVYVELANEVWNWSFPVTKQAAREGLEEGLSTNEGYAMLFRLAEKHAEVMDIWSTAFAGQEDRLVRVLANQSAAPANMDRLMAFRDTASKVDAIATAPYFAYNVDGKVSDPSNLTPVFEALRTVIDTTVRARIAAARTTAARYGKRVITYEAGQHVNSSDAALLTAINNDPRMGELYKHYLQTWQRENGDLMMLFSDVYKTSKNGSWGLVENASQLPAGTPKSAAVHTFQASISK